MERNTKTRGCGSQGHCEHTGKTQMFAFPRVIRQSCMGTVLRCAMEAMCSDISGEASKHKHGGRCYTTYYERIGV